MKAELSDAGINLIRFKVKIKLKKKNQKPVTTVENTSGWLKFGLKTSQIQRDYKIKDNKFTLFSVLSFKTQVLIPFPLRIKEINNKKDIKQMYLEEDFTSVVDMHYLDMNNLFEKVKNTNSKVTLT